MLRISRKNRNQRFLEERVQIRNPKEQIGKNQAQRALLGNTSRLDFAVERESMYSDMNVYLCDVCIMSRTLRIRCGFFMCIPAMTVTKEV